MLRHICAPHALAGGVRQECCVDAPGALCAWHERSHRYWEGLHENLRLAPTVYAGWRVGAAARLAIAATNRMTLSHRGTPMLAACVRTHVHAGAALHQQRDRARRAAPSPHLRRACPDLLIEYPKFAALLAYVLLWGCNLYIYMVNCIVA